MDSQLGQVPLTVADYPATLQPTRQRSLLRGTCAQRYQGKRRQIFGADQSSKSKTVAKTRDAPLRGASVDSAGNESGGGRLRTNPSERQLQLGELKIDSGVNVLQLRRLDDLNFYPEHALGERPAVEQELGDPHLQTQQKVNVSDYEPHQSLFMPGRGSELVLRAHRELARPGDRRSAHKQPEDAR